MAKRVDRFSQIVLGVFTRLFGNRLRREAATHRGAPCPCGSGLKYQRCCLRRETAGAKRTGAARKSS
jgi:hypothetical protein